MKNLKINPRDFEVELGNDKIEPGSEDNFAMTNVDVKFGEECAGIFAVTAAESKKIGEWFIGLSKELSKKDKK